MNQGLLDLVAAALTAAPEKNRLLVCHHDDASITGALHGLYTNIWWRTAAADKPATPWPAPATYDQIILPLPRGKETLQLCLAACTSVLSNNGVVWLFGLNELGIKSADKPLLDFFDKVEVVATGGHGRLWKASGLKPTAKTTLLDLQKNKVLELPDGNVSFTSYPGLFAGGNLDEGTALLISALPRNLTGEILDYACGIGVLARVAAAQNPSVKVTLADNDPLALMAASANVPGAVAKLTCMPTDITGSYDCIISNPPIHQGNAQSFEIVDLLLQEMPRLLKKNGQAFVVTQVTVPVPRLAKAHQLQCAEVAASRSFRVYRLQHGA